MIAVAYLKVANHRRMWAWEEVSQRRLVSVLETAESLMQVLNLPSSHCQPSAAADGGDGGLAPMVGLELTLTSTLTQSTVAARKAEAGGSLTQLESGCHAQSS